MENDVWDRKLQATLEMNGILRCREGEGMQLLMTLYLEHKQAHHVYIKIADCRN